MQTEEVIAASTLIRNSARQILVFEVKGFAALPGGSGERGETPEETAVRESFEETCLRVSIEKLVALYNLIVLNKDGTERCRFMHYLFLASSTHSNPRPGSEWQDSKCRWTTLKGLRRYRKVWPLPEEVRTMIAEGKLDLGNLGELKYQMV